MIHFFPHIKYTHSENDHTLRTGVRINIMDFCALVCTILVLIWGAIGLCTSDQDNGRAQYNLFLSLSY